MARRSELRTNFTTSRDPRLVVVVGPCASGKSTLVEGLRSRGYRAMVCGQEHSEIPNLWQHANPDVVVALSVDLPTLRQRRSPSWSESIYLRQLRRLQSALAAADLVLDTTRLDQDATLESVLSHLSPSEAP